MGEILLERKLLLTYGCQLDHSAIYALFMAHLAPFEIMSYEIPVSAPTESQNLLVEYDVYDVYWEGNCNKKIDWSFRYFLINEERLFAFKQALAKLPTGNHLQCHPSRGHIWVTIDDVEYATRTLITEEKKYILMDNTEEGNMLIRPHMHRLPPVLRYLTIDNEFAYSCALTYEEQQHKVKEWIGTINRYLNNNISKVD